MTLRSRPPRTAASRLARLALGIVLLHGGAALAQDARIVIGQSIALSGGVGEHGQGAAAGAKLYLDGINAAGGVAGRRVAVLTRDDGGDAKRAAENTRELIERDNVVAMLGGVEGGPCVATLKEASDRGVPLVACMAGSPEMREPFNRWSFPVRVAFVHADSDTGRRHLANVRRLAGDRGIDVAPIAMTAGLTPAALADAIARARVDAVFNHGSYSVYVGIIKSLRAKGLTPMFMAVNSGAAQMARELGPEGRGLVFTQVVPFPWGVAVPVVKEYQQALAKYAPGTPPSFSGLEGYIGAKVLVAGLRAAGRDLTRVGIQRAMEGLGTVDVGGMLVRYRPGAHAGSTFVDTVIVASDGRFSR
ncbi:MAG: ABC transporter substrate-binding protein [Betaproteobacteria bacterium]|nr:ABC transporter substrate-binding protein [Betaproteobacteria bacterium]